MERTFQQAFWQPRERRYISLSNDAEWNELADSHNRSLEVVFWPEMRSGSSRGRCTLSPTGPSAGGLTWLPTSGFKSIQFNVSS